MYNIEEIESVLKVIYTLFRKEVADRYAEIYKRNFKIKHYENFISTYYTGFVTNFMR